MQLEPNEERCASRVIAGGAFRPARLPPLLVRLTQRKEEHSSMMDQTTEQMVKSIKDALISQHGMSLGEAERLALDKVYSMGVTKVREGICPRHAISPIACMTCAYGHMTECHWPKTCGEANCSHNQAQKALELDCG
jgi:hypothetical protein